MSVIELCGLEAAHYEPLSRILTKLTLGEKPSVKLEINGVKGSLFFICSKRDGAGKFVYDMVSKWLTPDQFVSIPLFFNADFQRDKKQWTAGELGFILNDASHVERAKQRFKQIAKELEFGLSSPYFAQRILELKGLSGREKLSLVQQRLSALINRFHLDGSVLLTLQHFASVVSPLFVKSRFGSFLTRLMLHLDRGENKCLPLSMDTPLGKRFALGLIVNIEDIGACEIFTFDHALKAVKEVMPNSHLVHGSQYEQSNVLYFEIEKKNGDPFSLKEIQKLSQKQLTKTKEQLVRPIFAPRNEEEVMRGLITLSRELRFAKDLPQVMISFEKQQGDELLFTVLLVRLGKEPSLEELIGPEFVIEKIRDMGVLRSRYVKEGHVISVKIPSQDCYLEERIIDSLKARSLVASMLKEKIGVFRDFNGGILAQEMKNFEALKNLCPKASLIDLQEFFHALKPPTLKTILKPEELKALYLERRKGVS